MYKKDTWQLGEYLTSKKLNVIENNIEMMDESLTLVSDMVNTLNNSIKKTEETLKAMNDSLDNGITAPPPTVDKETVIAIGQFTAGTNVRDAGSTSGSIIGYQASGSTAEIINVDRTNGWYKIKYPASNTGYGYVSYKYCTLINSSNTVYKGVDLSKWNGNVDFTKLKTSTHKDFAILRIGYGSYQGNSITDDPKFDTYVKGCVDNKINYGIYFYTYARSVAAVEKECDLLIAKLNSLTSSQKKYLTYPIFFDLEEQDQFDLGGNIVTSMVQKFYDKLSKAGYYPGYYTNLNAVTNYYDMNKLQPIDLWFARYTTASTPDITHRFFIWQYTESGDLRNQGIPDSNVDMNRCYVNYPELIKKWKL